MNEGRDGLARVVLVLGVAGIELGRHPTDPAKLRHRPRELPPDMAALVRLNRPAVLRLLRGGWVPESGSESAHRLGERLGIADDLGMPTHPGSPAWLIAVGESLAVGCADAVSVDMADAAIQNRIPALEGA